MHVGVIKKKKKILTIKVRRVGLEVGAGGSSILRDTWRGMAVKVVSFHGSLFQGSSIVHLLYAFFCIISTIWIFLKKAMGSQCRDFTKVVGNMVSFIL